MRLRSSSRSLLVLSAWLGMVPFCAGVGEATAQPLGLPQSDPTLLAATPGITALSGRVLDAGGHPLALVRVVDNATSTETDAQGRFLLAPVLVGKSVVQIDGRHVGSGKAAVDYGFYEVQATAASGKTTQLGFNSWLTPIDHSHDVTIASPTTRETVISTPAIPGLEIRLAAGVVVRDAQGQAVTRIGITPMPPDHQPFPGPKNADQRMAFTIQPGPACLYTPAGGIGYARIVYPNYHHYLPRAREGFLRYEPDEHGWRVYGAGSVSVDGSQVIPDRDTVVTDFGSAECDPQTRSHPLIIVKPPQPVSPPIMKVSP